MHHCHAVGCRVSVPPWKLMCPPHWRQVPGALQRRVWDTYRRGQEIDKRPSPEWLAAATEAIAAVAAREGKSTIDLFGRRT